MCELYIPVLYTDELRYVLTELMSTKYGIDVEVLPQMGGSSAIICTMSEQSLTMLTLMVEVDEASSLEHSIAMEVLHEYLTQIAERYHD